MKARFILLGTLLCGVVFCDARNIDTSKNRMAFDEFVESITSDFDNFRMKAMADFAAFLLNPWKEFEETPPVPVPDVTPVPPVVMPDDDEVPINNQPVIIEEVIEPVLEDPRPQPVKPIEEVPVIDGSFLEFAFYGTPAKVRFSKSGMPSITSLSESAVSNAFKTLSSEDNDNMIIDCLRIREHLQLSDWAYLNMLKVLSEKATSNRNEATALLAYLYLQSGYMMRLAMDENYLLGCSEQCSKINPHC